MTQLNRIEPGNDIEQAHMRNRPLISKWCYERGLEENVIEKIVEKFIDKEIGKEPSQQYQPPPPLPPPSDTMSNPDFIKMAKSRMSNLNPEEREMIAQEVLGDDFEFEPEEEFTNDDKQEFRADVDSLLTEEDRKALEDYEKDTSTVADDPFGDGAAT